MKAQFFKAVALIATVLGAATFSTSVSATPVTDINGGTALNMLGANYFGVGPQTIAPGIIWSSDYGDSVYGYEGGYGFDSNGLWTGFTMVGSNSPTATMTFNFAEPVAGFGGFLNYAPADGSPAVISAYDSDDNLLDAFTLTFLTGDAQNSGEFHGFSESTANISSFKLTGSYIGGANFVVLRDVSAQVPEPGTIALLGLGLLGVVASRRKSAKS